MGHHTDIQNRQQNKYCLSEVNLISCMIKIFVVFSPIFLVNVKIIFRNDFVSPLNT